jgi:transcription termination factor Rho
MDEVIFEEFKGTGNCEIHLERRLYEKRVFPAINLNRSGTRREELLLQPEVLQKTRILRQFMYNMDEIEAMEMVLKSMKATKSNVEFFDMMRSRRLKVAYPHPHVACKSLISCHNLVLSEKYPGWSEGGCRI